MMHLAAFLFTPGGHRYGWRHPDADAASDMNFDVYVAMAQAAERGKLDAIFFADTAAVHGNHVPEQIATGKGAIARLSYLEPASLITALAPVTKDIGLIATMTTTYNEPYHVARRMASIDHISGGRAGWNLVTSQVEEEAWNFGEEKHVEHSKRYARASEFSDVVKALWDSWEEDGHVRDKVTGQIFDPKKVHIVDHRGEHFTVRGPLNVARPPQGHPIIAEAGSSEPGMELAARTADVVFTAQQTLENGQDFYADVKGRLERYGRSQDSMRILPGVVPIVAETDEAARQLLAEIEELMTVEEGMKALQRFAGDLDLSTLDPNGPLPDLPAINSAKSRQQVLIDMARRENLTIAQLAKRFTGPIGHRILCGSAKTIADDLQRWHENGAADGFILIFPFFPKPLFDFVDLVIPELQRRGLFRTEYEGSTLRENLGLSKPANQFHQT
jgi:FMN-dependent oxidoreductase (nitrilotriacetate monooxygenase family)